MKITDVFSPSAIALRRTTAASNSIPYLGKILFPFMKKAGLDLKWIKTSSGLPVAINPSAFDSKSTIRSREGFKYEKTQMMLFKDSFLVKEEDEQEIMRVQDSNDPYAQAVIDSVYRDADMLIAGAEVIPERMVMQLLSPTTGNPTISVSANGVTESYNYDPNDTYKTNNFLQLLSTDMWSNTTYSDPLQDTMDAIDAIVAYSGERPTRMLMSQLTMNWLVKNAKLQSYVLAQNTTANIYMTSARIKQLFMDELQIEIIVYTKQYKDESGTAHKFYPDNITILLPAGELGNTWFGTTPEERSGRDVVLYENAIAIKVTETTDPENTKTLVSEIVLPSYEAMDSTYAMLVHTDLNGVISAVVTEGTTSGTTVATMTPASATGYVYKYKENYSTLPAYGDDLSSWTTYTSGAEIASTEGNSIVIAQVDSTNYLAVDAIVITADVAA